MQNLEAVLYSQMSKERNVNTKTTRYCCVQVWSLHFTHSLLILMKESLNINQHLCTAKAAPMLHHGCVIPNTAALIKQHGEKGLTDRY